MKGIRVKSSDERPEVLTLLIDTQAITAGCVEGERLFLLVTLVKKHDAYGVGLEAEYDLEMFHESKLMGATTANKVVAEIEHELAVEKLASAIKQ